MPKKQGVRREVKRIKPYHGRKYELYRVAYRSIFRDLFWGYVIFEVDGRNRELMEVIEDWDYAEERFAEYAGW